MELNYSSSLVWLLLLLLLRRSTTPIIDAAANAPRTLLPRAAVPTAILVVTDATAPQVKVLFHQRNAVLLGVYTTILARRRLVACLLGGTDGTRARCLPAIFGGDGSQLTPGEAVLHPRHVHDRNALVPRFADALRACSAVRCCSRGDDTVHSGVHLSRHHGSGPLAQGAQRLVVVATAFGITVRIIIIITRISIIVRRGVLLERGDCHNFSFQGKVVLWILLFQRSGR